MTDADRDAVIAFWFDDLRPADWWRATPAIDARVHDRFAALHAALARTPPEAASLDARGHLAAIVVFDQFSRHLFRGTAAAFATDGLAVALADDAIARGLDVVLPPVQRHFVWMPLMHAEDRDLQRRSVALFATLDDPRALRTAERHRATIERFGRFPARNAALGRTSTADEAAYLATRFSRS